MNLYDIFQSLLWRSKLYHTYQKSNHSSLHCLGSICNCCKQYCFKLYVSFMLFPNVFFHMYSSIPLLSPNLSKYPKYFTSQCKVFFLNIIYFISNYESCSPGKYNFWLSWKNESAIFPTFSSLERACFLSGCQKTSHIWCRSPLILCWAYLNTL